MAHGFSLLFFSSFTDLRLFEDIWLLGVWRMALQETLLAGTCPNMLPSFFFSARRMDCASDWQDGILFGELFSGGPFKDLCLALR